MTYPINCTLCNTPIRHQKDHVIIQIKNRTVGNYHRHCNNERRRQLSN